jgi:hypothetical protein
LLLFLSKGLGFWVLEVKFGTMLAYIAMPKEKAFLGFLNARQ